jgi:hypothetical protein
MVPSVSSEKIPPLGIDPETLQLVVQCLNNYATPRPSQIQQVYNIYFSLTLKISDSSVPHLRLL